jgi:hypothetical protein
MFLYLAASNQGVPEEQVRCNICNIVLSQKEAKDHASTSPHMKHKSKLEEDLKAVRNEQYKDDSSVVLEWQGSI